MSSTRLLDEASYFSALEFGANFRPTVIRKLLSSASSITEAFSLLIADIDNRSEVEKAYDKALKTLKEFGPKLTILKKGCEGYPASVSQFEDSPQFLFVEGNAELLSKPGVAVVGSRKASEEGCVRAYKLARLLVENNYVVTSGLAKGIDSSAHIGCLSAGGSTIAVIGTPPGKYYPKEHVELQDAIAKKGAVVTQFSPLRATQPLNFPIRNELMSALSLATVIVEASETSGALIQAKQCLKQGRKLFIMQNQIDRTDLKWPREFLKKGARSLSNLDDLLQGLADASLPPEQLKLT